MSNEVPYPLDGSTSTPSEHDNEVNAVVVTRSRNDPAEEHSSNSGKAMQRLLVLAPILFCISALITAVVPILIATNDEWREDTVLTEREYIALTAWTGFFGMLIWFLGGALICVVIDLSTERESCELFPLILAVPITIVLSIYVYLAGYAMYFEAKEMAFGWAIYYTPQPYQGCNTRVDLHKALLFTPDIYLSPFKSPPGTLPESLTFNETIFANPRNNETLCGKGFQGNSDLYGLGIRIGIYTQWIASLCANHLLPANGKELQKVYLIFSIAICVTTLVSNFRNTCIFSIEIEVLYWIFRGGSICVFASAPSTTRLGSRKIWMGLNWSTALQLLTHLIMFYHSIWFIWYAYDYVFAKMPCGTHQFLLARLLDPCVTFRFVRSLLAMACCPLAFSLALLWPLVGIIFAAEATRSFQQRLIFQTSFSTMDDCPAVETEQAEDVRPLYISALLRVCCGASYIYRGIRERVGLPAHSQQGIHLITPLDLKHRRKSRIFCAVIGAASWILSIIAIELTLKWNRVTGVYSFVSTGQYMPLTIGSASLISVLWRLLTREAKRRRKMASYQVTGEDLEGIELQSTNLSSNSLAAAISHAFQQADVEFLMDGGVDPHDLEEAIDDERPTTSHSSRLSTGSFHSANVFVMSSAVDLVGSSSDPTHSAMS